ncbi:tail fiber assembly protein [Alcaligenes aquatilis]|uniref:tail fiber assembly protein n=1 Tax=Alcaligenes aquatilis TaxID=323284 RepID=UPI003D25EAB7
MKQYVLIIDGAVAETLETGGDIAVMFHPDLEWVEVTDIDPMPQAGWLFDGHEFSLPSGPSTDRVLLTNTATRDALMRHATVAMAPLQDAVDLDDATSGEILQLEAWKRYRALVNRVDLAHPAPKWPEVPMGSTA